MRNRVVLAHFAFVSAIAVSGCGSTVDVPPEITADSGEGDEDGNADSIALDSAPPDDSGDPVDSALPDTAPEPDAAPPGCAGAALAIDPASSLDPLVDGPLKVAHATVTVPKLGPLTDVKVKIHYPVTSDGVTPDPGRHAWVMFHHAVHGPYPGVTYDRYDGIFDRWASHGIITFSIDGSKIFFPPPPCPTGSTPSGSGCYSYQSYAQLKQVAGMMDEAITHFLDEQEDSTFPLHCALDASRVAVGGHSRGGGSALLVTTARTDGAKIKAYVGFQPVNPEFSPGAPTPPSAVPVFDIPALWLDSGNDGDVDYPNTAMIYAHTRSIGSHVTILGSKHTYTLDTPFPDQGGPAATITPEEHRRVTNYYSVPFLRAFVRDASPAAADLDRVTGPSGLSVASTVSTGDATLRYRPADTDGGWVQKFDEALGTTPTSTVAGGAITLSGGMSAVSYETYATSTTGASTLTRSVSRLIRSVRLNWGTTEAAIDIALPSLAGKKGIAFETTDLSSPSSTSGTHPLYIELTDTTGATSSLPLATLTPVSWSKRPRRLSGVYVPLTRFTGVDLTRAKSLRFVAKAGTPNHDVLIDLLRLE